jgi:hypothetical protein
MVTTHLKASLREFPDLIHKIAHPRDKNKRINSLVRETC